MKNGMLLFSGPLILLLVAQSSFAQIMSNGLPSSPVAPSRPMPSQAFCFTTGGSVTLTAIPGTQTPPPRPQAAEDATKTNVTVINAKVGTDGSIASAVLRSSTGSAVLNAAALDYVRQNWKWQPLDGCASAEAVIGVLWQRNGVVAFQIRAQQTASLPAAQPAAGAYVAPFQPPPANASVGCTSSDADLAKLARENGYRYAAPTCTAPVSASPASFAVPPTTITPQEMARLKRLERDDTELAPIFAEFCIRDFPDEGAVSQYLSAHGAKAMSQAEVAAYLHADPGRGWYMQTSQALYGLTIETPPVHTCAVRRMTPNGMSTNNVSRAIQDYVKQTGGKAVLVLPPMKHLPNGPDVQTIGTSVLDSNGKLTDAFGIYLSNYHHRPALPMAVDALDGVGLEVRISRTVMP
jgi:Gram-negative bacterial TonB protein C-terminal